MPEQSEGLCAGVIDGGLAQEGCSTGLVQEGIWKHCVPLRAAELRPASRLKPSVEKRTPPLLDLRGIAANVVPGH
jgi:hypothetical protein